MAYSATHSASPNSMADCPQLDKPMPPFPSNDDADATWNYLQAGVDRIMTDGKEGIDTKTYMGLYNAIHNFCTAQTAVESGGFGANNGGASNRGGAHLLGEDLYNQLIEYLKGHVRDVYEKSTDHADEALLTFYIKEWNRYSAAAKDIDCLFGYLNRHWVKREMDEGKKNIYDIYTLHLVLWKDDMFMQTQENIVKPVLRLVEKQRDGETIEQNQIKSVVDSFVSLGLDESDSTKTTLDVYKEFFEKPFLEATADYYRKESSRFLAENSVVDYMKYVEALLEEEKERVSLYLLDEIMGPLMRTCETVLIADHAQTLREELQLLLDQDRIEDLARMYMLLARIPNGLDPLRTRFENHVRKAGLSAVEKVATRGTSFTYARHFSKPSDFHTTVSTMNAQNIILTTSEGVNIEVERQVAERSILIKNLLGYFGAEPGEPLPVNVKERVMRKVIEWCEHHKKDPPVSTDDDWDSRKKSTDIDEWDQEFMQVDGEMLSDIILTANYLDIKALLDVGCKTVANMVKGKSSDEICKIFNIQNDFPPEEEDQMSRENERTE